VPVSRFHRAISAIIEPIWNGSYEIWKAASAFRDAVNGKGVWVLGKPEGVCGFLVCVYLKCSKVTGPNPLFGFEGFENLPRFSNPPLTGLNLTRSRRGEQFLQVSVILRFIPRDVHGAGLKPSELI
jgi:hypothetical protein